MKHRFLLTALAGLVFGPCLTGAEADPSKKDGAEPATPVIAHVRLSGSLDEAPSAEDPLFGSSSENLASRLERLAKAAKDPLVKAVYLEIHDLGIGWAKVEEVRVAIAKLRAAGKKVYAHMESAESKDLLVALASDVVCMPESGEVMLPGIRAEVTFYKDFFEKVHLQADFLQMGDFKGAAEPYIRNSMSPQFRKQFETVIDDFYRKDLIQTVVVSRPAKKWTAEQVKGFIDEGAFTAQRAKELGLIDRLRYATGMEEMIKKDLKLEKVKLVRQYGKTKQDEVDLSNPFAIFKLLAPQKPKTSKKPKIAVIYAVGEIVSGRGEVSLMGEDQVASTPMVEAIRQAEKDETVKAIVLRVDSPGGSALASDVIWKELVNCKKPVVASMGDVAASGGYYISMAARKIYASPGTLTGSIGVVGGKIVTGKLFDWLGMKTEIISRGANSGMMSSERAWNDSERQVMTQLMQNIYDQFLDKALQGRKRAGVEMNREKLLTLAGGRIWTGRQAKEAGLIDALGTLDDAVASAKEMAGEAGKDLEILVLPRPRSFIEKLADSTGDVQAPHLGLESLAAWRSIPGLESRLRTARALLRLQAEKVWLMDPVHIQVK